jgi:hypothetical protein
MPSHRARTLVHVSAFQRRYSDRQKRAVGAAQYHSGMTALAAIDALMRGELVDPDGPVPPPADVMPKRTAYDCAKRVRDEHEGRRGGLEGHEPAAIQAELRRRLVTAADRLTQRVERKSRTGRAGMTDAQLADTLTKAARAAKEVAAYIQATEPKPEPIRKRGDVPEPTSQPVDATPLGALAAEIDAEDRRSRRAAASASAPRT